MLQTQLGKPESAAGLHLDCCSCAQQTDALCHKCMDSKHGHQSHHLRFKHSKRCCNGHEDAHMHGRQAWMPATPSAICINHKRKFSPCNGHQHSQHQSTASRPITKHSQPGKRTAAVSTLDVQHQHAAGLHREQLPKSQSCHACCCSTPVPRLDTARCMRATLQGTSQTSQSVQHTHSSCKPHTWQHSSQQLRCILSHTHKVCSVGV